MEAESSRQRVLSIISLVVLILDLAVFLAMAVMMPVTAQTFRKIFAEMNTQLPSLTMFFLRVPTPAYPAVLAIIGATMIAKEFLLSPAARLVVNLVVLPLAVLVAGAYVFSLFLPMMQMIQVLQS